MFFHRELIHRENWQSQTLSCYIDSDFRASFRVYFLFLRTYVVYLIERYLQYLDNQTGRRYNKYNRRAHTNEQQKKDMHILKVPMSQFFDHFKAR